MLHVYRVSSLLLDGRRSGKVAIPEPVGMSDGPVPATDGVSEQEISLVGDPHLGGFRCRSVSPLLQPPAPEERKEVTTFRFVIFF